jgi:hypothetical protein
VGRVELCIRRDAISTLGRCPKWSQIGTGIVSLELSAMSSHISIGFCLRRRDICPTHKYATGDDIREHASRIGAKFGLYDRTLFQTETKSMRWSEETSSWNVKTELGDTITSRFVILAAGPIYRTQVPPSSWSGYIPRPYLPYGLMGLRIHRRRPIREPQQARGQARGHYRNRHDQRAGCAACWCCCKAAVRVPTHAIFDQCSR